jgi:hypothetical protein
MFERVYMCGYVSGSKDCSNLGNRRKRQNKKKGEKTLVILLGLRGNFEKKGL